MIRHFLALIIATASCFAQVNQAHLKGTTANVQTQINNRLRLDLSTNILSGDVIIDGSLTNDFDFDDIARLTLDATDASVTGVATVYVDGGITTVRGVTNLQVITPAVFAGTATSGQVLRLTDPVEGTVEFATVAVSGMTADIATLLATTNYWSFGDSQTAGANAATTNYTSGGSLTAGYRWPNLLAASQSLNLTNLGKGGSSHSYNTSSSITRQTPINQFGANVPTTWTGLCTLMIGYNNINLWYQMPKIPAFFQNAQEAFIARALLTDYVGVGTAGETSTGSTWTSWSTDGSQTLSGNTDDAAFTTGSPGTDQRTRLVLTGTQRFGVTLTNKAVAAIFYDAHVDGGLLYVYTNGAFAGQIDAGFAALAGDSSASAFPGVLWLENLQPTTSITATNASGTNYVLAVGYLDSTTVSGRTIIVGSPIRSYVFGEPYGPETAMTAATQRAVAGFRNYPVYYADVNGRWNPAQNNDIQDRDHLNPAGNIAVFDAFSSPIKPLGKYDYDQAGAILAGFYTAKASGTNLYDIARIDSNRLVVGQFDGVNSQRSLLAVSGTNTVVSEVGFMSDGQADTNQVWAIRRNTGATPLLRFVKYSGGSPAGVAIDLNWSDLSVTHAAAMTNSGKATFGADLVMAGSEAPTLAMDSTGTKTFAWKTNGVTTFSQQAITSDTILRTLVHDASGTAAGTAYQLYRGGQTRFPLAVTNESTTSLQGAVTVGIPTTLARLTLQSAAATENRVIWASGAVATNRITAGLVLHDVFRLTALSADGSATSFVPLQVDVASGNVTHGGTRTTNTSITTFTSATAPIFKSGAQLDDDSGNSGGLFLSATNLTHWRVQEIAGVLSVTRFSDAGAAVATEFAINRTTGATTIGSTGTATTRIRHGVATLVGGAVTVSDSTVTSSSRIIVTSQADGGTPGWLRVSARVASTSFTITSSSGTDTSTVAWVLIEP